MSLKHNGGLGFHKKRIALKALSSLIAQALHKRRSTDSRNGCTYAKKAYIACATYAAAICSRAMPQVMG